MELTGYFPRVLLVLILLQPVAPLGTWAQATHTQVARDTIYVVAPQQDSATEHWAKVAPGFFMPATFAAILLTGLAQFALLLRLKRADVIYEMNQQYDRVLEKKYHTVPIQGQDYWNSFWDVQARQYDEWQDGLIRRESFCVWMVG
jgi:hypothetical protein